MALGSLSIQEAEGYLRQLEELSREIDYARNELANRIGAFRQRKDVESQVDLQSSIAYFEKTIRPVIARQVSPERRFTDPFSNLVLAIDDEWQAYEFRQLFQGVDYLNKLFVIRYKLTKDSPDLRLSRGDTHSRISRYSLLYYYLSSYEELHVRSVQYASPGSINLEGIAPAIKEVKDLLSYIFTFQFVKGFVDLYDHFKYDRQIDRTEKRIRLKDLIRREQTQDRKFAADNLDEYKNFLSKMNEIADLTVQLESKGLAKSVTVEETVMNSISLLSRLGFDEQKVKLGDGTKQE
jgi:hypothetical protein